MFYLSPKKGDTCHGLSRSFQLPYWCRRVGPAVNSASTVHYTPERKQSLSGEKLTIYTQLAKRCKAHYYQAFTEIKIRPSSLPVCPGKYVFELEIPPSLSQKLNGQNVLRSNVTSASGPPFSRLGQSGDILVVLLPSGGMAAVYRQGIAAEGFRKFGSTGTQKQPVQRNSSLFRRQPYLYIGARGLQPNLNKNIISAGFQVSLPSKTMGIQTIVLVECHPIWVEVKHELEGNSVNLPT
ncbi:hypothetical protein CSKR_106254 [Clonorchis sinensis]|uniref:Uncharacterized protein n=1 Tax=Clonorchis sinensis TaxID=79923 RepID=A0A3R7JPA1_CLOSI|nr:hypothetical protein CSKR_106254 [Clonorchis sinensis]